jgi:hypothetical protein
VQAAIDITQTFARSQFGSGGRLSAVSRILAMAGLVRKEVARLISRPAGRVRESEARYSRTSRVIAGWRRDPDFSAPLDSAVSP